MIAQTAAWDLRRFALSCRTMFREMAKQADLGDLAFERETRFRCL